MARKSPIVTLGGNGANAAFAAARCGAEVTLHTHIGDDPFGRAAREWLKASGCRIQVSEPEVPTAVNVTGANARHERATLFYPGSLRSRLGISTRALAAPKRVFVCGWPHPSLKELARGFREFQRDGAYTALDVGPILGTSWSLAGMKGVFAGLDLFIANEFELCAITRVKSLAQGLEALRARFEGAVVIKRGPKGALWLAPGATKRESVAGRKVKALNTVGAGDCFNGALLAALERGSPLGASVEYGCLVASKAVSSPRGVLGIAGKAGRG